MASLEILSTTFPTTGASGGKIPAGWQVTMRATGVVADPSLILGYTAGPGPCTIIGQSWAPGGQSVYFAKLVRGLSDETVTVAWPDAITLPSGIGACQFFVVVGTGCPSCVQMDRRDVTLNLTGMSNTVLYAVVGAAAVGAVGVGYYLYKRKKEGKPLFGGGKKDVFGPDVGGGLDDLDDDLFGGGHGGSAKSTRKKKGGAKGKSIRL